MSFRGMPRVRSFSRRAQPRRAIVSRETLNIDGLQVTVVRKNNRNMYLHVKPPYGMIEITAPTRMSKDVIVSFVRERRGWIEEALRNMAEARQRTFASTEVDSNVPSSSVMAHGDRGSTDVGAPSGDSFTWNEVYKERARESIEQQLPALLRKWEPVVGRSPSRITLRTMSSRWGSCTPKTARIRLNLQLGLMDPKFLEYVLVHEMTHLWESGHGAAFQARMTDYLPNWKQLRRELNRCTLLADAELKG